jgi:hypothetical protein
MGKFRDSVTNKLDSVGLANPFEVVNEALGGETREESKARRDKEKAKEAQPAAPIKPVSNEEQKRHSARLKTLWEREKKERGLTQKQLADEANKDIGGPNDTGMRKGGKVKSASQRADGCAIRGKTRA